MSLRGEPGTVAVVARYAVLADWLCTATTLAFQPLSGWRLAHLAGLPLATPWIAWSFTLYAVAGACWLPVVAIQIRMRRMAEAEAAARRGLPLPPAYRRLLGAWVALGIPALVALLAVFWLMVAKPG